MIIIATESVVKELQKAFPGVRYEIRLMAGGPGSTEERINRYQYRQRIDPVRFHYAWTRNLSQMLSHDAPFTTYLVTHNRTVHIAVETLRTGATLAEAAARCNVSSPSTLRKMIRREFDTYLEKIV